MRAWSVALAHEITDWPEVTTRAFFGFTALYRKSIMFALLPRTRGMGTANSLAFKLENPSLGLRLGEDPRMGATEIKKARWYTFELSSDTDLHGALDWLGRAYQAASAPRKRP